MKPIIIILAASLLGSTPIVAQHAPVAKTTPSKTTVTKTTTKTMSTTVPPAVSNAFKQKFPHAEKVKWDKENAHEYEANFVMNGTPHSANFNTKGEWLETETEIKTSELPQKVTESIKTKYPGNQIVGAARIESADKSIIYEADLKKGAMKKEVMLKPDGSMAKNNMDKD